ncbi:MAG: DoxX family protein [Parcubacteria group bacterium CG_4_10_14_0_8_um_filter_35_7]|nr:MAG: DoxX family protein [Parcubacteria group bacterium CG_4_10_14_0_8_um_filter_35_7]
MIHACKKHCGMISSWADLLTRIVVGLIFIVTGYGKLFAAPGISGFSGMLAGLGFPAPTFFAVLVGVIEFAGGILMILGIFTSAAASLLAFIMLVAVVAVHLKAGWTGFQYQLLLMVVLLRYVGTAGKYSLEHYFCTGKKKQ